MNLSVNASGEIMPECQKCLELETELVKKKDFVDKETYDKLCKCFTNLEKHCITLEADSQLNQEIFQQENSVLNQNAPSFSQLFELSELKAQSQAKDTVIVKLKEHIKSLKGNGEDSSVKLDMDEIETLNIELEHRVTKLVTENEHLKQTYKQLYDSIKPKRVQSKEQCDALIKQVNIKSGEISDLNAKLQEQGLVIAALKNELRKLKGKALDNKETVTHSVDPNMSKDNMEPITPKLLNKRTAHSSYIKHTQEEALVLRDIVEHVKANYPQDPLLESAFRYTKVIQDLLSHISRSCPSINNCGPQLIEVIPRTKDKKVRFAESLTPTENTKSASTSNIVSNKRVLHSTGVRHSTSASGSQPSGNTKNDRILQTPSSVVALGVLGQITEDQTYGFPSYTIPIQWVLLSLNSVQVRSDYKSRSSSVAELPEEENVSESYIVGLDDGERKPLLIIIKEGINIILLYSFQVLAYDLESRNWSKVKDLGTKTLFVGYNSSFWTEDTTGVIEGSCIYYTETQVEVDECTYGEKGIWRDMVIYHLLDGTIEPHFAAESLSRVTPPTWLQSIFKFTKNNIYGTHVLLEACKVSGQIRRFIHVSTDEVYGETDEDAIGEVGHVYNIGTRRERRVIDVAKDMCKLFNTDANASITFVENRPFNDQRYFLDDEKLKSLGWSERTRWEEGLKKTIGWYASNPNWWGDVSGALLPHPRMLMTPGGVDRLADGPGHTEFDAADPAINTAQIGVQVQFPQRPVATLLKNQLYEYGRGRLEDRSQLLSDIQTIKHTHVFNAAGVTCRPNLDWCESHKTETICTNVTGTLNLADVYREHGLLMINYASGCIFKYDAKHLERFRYVRGIPNGMTILDELLPISIEMAKRNQNGIWNFSYPGVVSHNEILEMYKKYINPEFKWVNFTLEEQAFVIKAPRSYNELDASKLKKEVP
ncbi:trifunctional UDP-glucose 4,6-dehydratase/UDP-4-keto-6-deoxy-D-glucose 3,5-epimerase/UDP-4-keto-L-rhamnose-reductase RHM1 [Tanacetum coccineum]|uniref:Trifunctional UDP-glucose 4,6-dehydratase/UDP-4-keto-6-deoxy-D-glucose 3,5-epimerase/UDP-4-keto-L-rhamnose-reductase RHM1 n=1 Tax=Tanacetum coccineum TaxID=301880 RepID=A0ABQ5GES7_9ASTR